MLREKGTASKNTLKPPLHRLVRSILERYEWLKLKQTLLYTYNTSPFYHQLFNKYHIKPRDIISYADMTKLPMTTPGDLQTNTRSFFCVPEQKFVKVFTTSGTTSEPKKAYFTQHDLDSIITSSVTGIRLMYHVTANDSVRLTFEEGYGTEIWGNRYCLERIFTEIGALTLVTGRLKIEDELKILLEYKPTIFMDVSSRINYLTNELKKIHDLDTLGITRILLGAEPTPNTMRKNIEKTWNTDVYIGYGTTELGMNLAGECEEKQGMHLTETDILTEVIDPKTGEHLEDGEIGELVFTTINRKGMPFIRYRSNDLGRIIPDRCPCGLPLKKIEIKGRTDDMLPIGAGDNLFTRMFDDILFGQSEIIEYQAIFERRDGKDYITIVAETNTITDALRKKIFDGLMELPEINNGVIISNTVAPPLVQLVKPNTLDRNSIKARRLIDKRNLYD
jgi:phenylacetate-CoA ligase